MQLDVTKPDEVEAAVQAALARFGRIDVLVNNAGIGYFGSVEESELDEVRRHVRNQPSGVLLPSRGRFCLPCASSGPAPSSTYPRSAAFAAGPAVGFYNATKFAVEGLSEALSLETAPLGIKVLLVEPRRF